MAKFICSDASRLEKLAEQYYQFEDGEATSWSFTADGGLTVLVAHGRKDGSLGCGLNTVMATSPDRVVCCYPGRVKQRYPRVPVVGGWRGQTDISFDLRWAQSSATLTIREV